MSVITSHSLNLGWGPLLSKRSTNINYKFHWWRYRLSCYLLSCLVKQLFSLLSFAVVVLEISPNSIRDNAWPLSSSSMRASYFLVWMLFIWEGETSQRQVCDFQKVMHFCTHLNAVHAKRQTRVASWNTTSSLHNWVDSNLTSIIQLVDVNSEWIWVSHRVLLWHSSILILI